MLRLCQHFFFFDQKENQYSETELSIREHKKPNSLAKNYRWTSNSQQGESGDKKHCLVFL